MPKNVLFIMCDQLRWDYLSCYGHPSLHTPNIDRLASMGVRFTQAYAQSTICGPSRMSFYTGRYVRSHGSTWNGFPLKAGEPTLGDHLRPLGVRTALVGKTHMKADYAGMERLGISPDTDLGVLVSECGFEPYERDDGLHPDGPYDQSSPYNDYLTSVGYPGKNPWNEWANAAEVDGELISGWYLRSAKYPARVEEIHSETPYMTRRAIDFIKETGDQSWCLHLSFIKPHWPYIAPAPYHALYRKEDILPIVRSEVERRNPHPILEQFMKSEVSQSFSDEHIRETVIPAYMGLVKQIDDQIGLLLDWLETNSYLENTLIVFTSDHGDYLGDHWLGEKEMFHDASVRIPLIVYDPSEAADSTRGGVSDLLVEAIDLAPTFLEFFGSEPRQHILEGRSLLPVLHDRMPLESWRDVVISEYDYSMRPARINLNVPIEDARMIMAYDGRWKYIMVESFRSMLFDLKNDPEELHDLGADDDYKSVFLKMERSIFEWSRRHHSRVTVSDSRIEETWDKEKSLGILIGCWDKEHN